MLRNNKNRNLWKYSKIAIINEHNNFWIYSTVHSKVYMIQHCDEVCQWHVTGQWFSLDTLVSSTNRTDHQNITEILFKVVLNTIIIPLMFRYWFNFSLANSYLFLQNELCVSFGPGKDMFDSTRIIAENQYRKAWVIYYT